MKGIFTNLNNAASRFGHKLVFKMKKASPELLLIGGIACLVGGTVLACTQTRNKVNDILDEGNRQIEEPKKYLKDPEANLSEEDEKLVRKEIAKIRVNTAGKLIAAYAPAAAIGTAGIAMIFSSHGIMKRRNVALLASYNALDAMFKQYRARVMEDENGIERDHRYLTERQPSIDEMNELDFIHKMNKDAAQMAVDYGWYSPTSCRFDATTSSKFSMYPFNNLNVIREVEACMSSRLKRNGYVFINDALLELGMDPVPWGQMWGRIWDPDDSDLFEIVAIEDNPDVPGSSITLEFVCDGAVWYML